MGASLLAKAVNHSTSVLTDPPLSRAGSLPQGTCVLRLLSGLSAIISTEGRLNAFKADFYRL
ncbi:hypothetical protein FQ185_05850 [Pseudomonas sp. ANT_H12B]|nr:hypothetical protein FQ185_05850 [Pseudomonas sp. ANT_H12B]